jgi:hypothetical protein
MNTSTRDPSSHEQDADLSEQARPGHGVPSQDPSPAAQVALDPEEAEREAQSALTGGGVVAGGAAGAAIGAIVAGPVGVGVGAAIGAVAGAVGGAVAAAPQTPQVSSSDAGAARDDKDKARPHIDGSGGG